jgi:hypothetical protein
VPCHSSAVGCVNVSQYLLALLSIDDCEISVIWLARPQMAGGAPVSIPHYFPSRVDFSATICMENRRLRAVTKVRSAHVFATDRGDRYVVFIILRSLCGAGCGGKPAARSVGTRMVIPSHPMGNVKNYRAAAPARAGASIQLRARSCPASACEGAVALSMLLRTSFVWPGAHCARRTGRTPSSGPVGARLQIGRPRWRGVWLVPKGRA